MKINVANASNPVFTHEGGRGTKTGPLQELHRGVLTCLLWEDTFYEKGSEITARICDLVPKCDPHDVAALAKEARTKFNLRHVPLLLCAELARVKGNGTIVADTLESVIQRADELTEFLAIYWRNGKCKLSAGVKRGLARAFPKFNEYNLAKYNRDGKVKLRDVLFLVHPSPKDEAQQLVWNKLVDKTLTPPDTWEVELSAGKDKKEVFTRLLTEGKLGGLATLRNLRNMLSSGVDTGLIRNRLSDGISRAFPYRFVVAAKHAPQLEDAIEQAMYLAVKDLEALPGQTGLLIDVSGSMDYALTTKNESRSVFQPENVANVDQTSRIDVASGLAILLREKGEIVRVATFSSHVVEVPNRRGFALRDAIKSSQPHSSTYLKRALKTLQPMWRGLDRLIVITDEQSQDGIFEPWTGKKSYVINVAPYKTGVSYRNGWLHIDGWSERVMDYIQEIEKEEEGK